MGKKRAFAAVAAMDELEGRVFLAGQPFGATYTPVGGRFGPAVNGIALVRGTGGAGGDVSKIVVVGATEGTTQQRLLAVFNADGTPDTSFGTGGVLAEQFGSFSAVDVAPDGTVIAVGDGNAGSSAATPDFAMVVERVNLGATAGTGVVDTFFPGDDGRSLLINPDESYFVGGSTTDGSATVFRFKADGTLDTQFGNKGTAVALPASSFGTSVGAMVTDMASQAAAQGSGQDLIAVVKAVSSDGSRVVAVRLKPDGTLDKTFGDNGLTVIATEPVNVLGSDPRVAVEPDGSIVMALSEFTSPNSHVANPVLVHLSSNGRVDASFVQRSDVGANIAPADLAVLPSGKILVLDSNRYRLARFNADGTVDSTFVDRSAEIFSALSNPFSLPTSVGAVGGGALALVGNSIFAAGRGNEDTNLGVVLLNENIDIAGTTDVVAQAVSESSAPVVGPGGMVTVTPTVAVNGTAGAGSFEIRYYLDKGTELDDSAQLLGTTTFNGAADLTAPVSFAVGNVFSGMYHVIEKVVDVGEFEESNGFNNVAVSGGTVVISNPPVVSVTGTTVGATQTAGVPFTATVHVAESGDPASFRVRLFLSPTPNLDGSTARLVGGPVVMTNVLGNADVSLTSTVPVKSSAGNYFLIPVVDQLPNGATPVGSGAAIMVQAAPRLPDYAAIITGPKNPRVMSGDLVSVQVAVKNIGLAAGTAADLVVILYMRNRALGASAPLVPVATARVSGKVAVGKTGKAVTVAFRAPQVARVLAGADFDVIAKVNAGTTPAKEIDASNDLNDSAQLAKALHVTAKFTDLKLSVTKLTDRGASVVVSNQGTVDAVLKGPIKLSAVGSASETSNGIVLVNSKLALTVKAGKSAPAAFVFKPQGPVIGVNFVKAEFVTNLGDLIGVSGSGVDFTP